ncbi:MAG TPA: hypothetical protein VM753_08785, partial [Anaeromyxobacter sp.]|nr:hypothetical protein [Anaeromyxobacter sp.]
MDSDQASAASPRGTARERAPAGARGRGPARAGAGPQELWGERAAAVRADATALALIAIATLLHVGYAGLFALSPQEAYYWEWARRLDLSYFDHPPLAAWTIRAATELLGTSERGVRAAAAF